MAKVLLVLSWLMLLTNQSLSFLTSYPTIIIQPMGEPSMQATMQRHAPSSLSEYTSRPNIALLARKSNNNNDDDTNGSANKIMGVFQKNPGTIIVVPFVALFGLDLIANILVVTKRSLEGEFNLACDNILIYTYA